MQKTVTKPDLYGLDETIKKLIALRIKTLLVMSPSEARSHRTNRKKLFLAMRLTILLLTVALFSAHAEGTAQNVTISGKNLTLKQVFTAIKKQTGYLILSNKEMLADAKTISLSVSNLPLKDLLDVVLKDQSLDYIIKDKTIFLSLKSSAKTKFSVASPFDVPPITGVVRDPDGNVLVGASIQVKGTQKGTVTDANGRFSLDVNTGEVLVISYLGFEEREVKVNDRTILDIVIRISIQENEAVTVGTGYWTTTKRNNTGNISKVTSKEIENQPVNNLLAAIQARVPGLEIVQQSGLPGANFKVRIRGRNSINSGNDPLYIIDGTPYPSQLIEGLLGPVNALGSSLNFINLSNIESIEVLKDADATSIYGARGANGVIIITTKKGRAGKTQVDVNISSGFGKVTRKLDLMNKDQYFEMRKEAFANDGETPDEFNAPDLTVWQQNKSTDWQDYFIGGTSRYSNIQAFLSGGTDNLQYQAGINHRRETTVYPDDGSNKNNGIYLKLSSTPADKKFHFDLGVNYVEDASNLPETDFVKYIMLAPNAPQPFNADGSLNWAPSEFQQTTWENPMTESLRTYKNKSDNLIATGNFRYQILQGLEFKTNVGFTRLQQSQLVTRPITSMNPSWGIMQGESLVANTSIRSWNAEPQLSYGKNLSKGRLDLLVGTSFQESISEAHSFAGQGYVDDALLEDISSATEIVKLNSILANYRYASAYGRVAYQHKDRYLLNITARRDVSNKFGPGKRTGNFASVGAGWIFSEERWTQQHLPFLSFGKIRSSYGTSGNDQIPNYQFVNTYSVFGTSYNTYPYQGIVGLAAENFYNPNYSWEINKKFEAALELGLLNDRISTSISYYLNQSGNQLVGYALPSFAGFNTVQANLPALVRNTGVELSLNTVNIRSSAFNWNSSLNLTISRNKLIDFPNLESSSYAMQYVVGQSLDIRRLFKYAGVNTQTGLYEFMDHEGKPTSLPDYDNDRIMSLLYSPRFYGGFSNEISYHGFSLGLLFQFTKQKGTAYLVNGYSPGVLNENQPVTALGRWQKEGDVANVQKFSQNSGNPNSSEWSNYTYRDASFVRLKNASLTYNFDKDRIAKTGLKQLRVFIEAQNLLTISSYKGVDPENQSLLSLPPLRMITAGVHLSF